MKTFKLKLVIGGERSSERLSFLNRTTMVEEEIGVSFKSLECIVNNTDSFKLIMWDLNPVKDVFGFMYPQFCKGAKACLLFVDLSNSSSLDELPYWISLFKDTLEKAPIFLLGTISPDKPQEIFEKDLNDLIKEHELDNTFFLILSDVDKRKKKEEIFKHLVERINTTFEIESFKIISPLEDQKFIDFYSFFLNCPICDKKNHESYLAKFFYSQDPEVARLRTQILELVNESRYFDELYLNYIKLGIPCCSCYQDIFNKEVFVPL